MSRVGDRIRFSVTGTPGTGNFVAASAPSTYLMPASAIPAIQDQDLVSYIAIDGSNWETGRGIWNSGTTTLSGRTVVESSNSNSLVSFTSSVIVSFTFLATDLPQTWYDQVVAADGAWPSISNIPAGWANLKLQILGRSADATAGQTNRHVLMKINGDAGANYSYTGMGYSTSIFTSAGPTNGGTAGIDIAWVSNVNGPANEYSFIEALLLNYTSTVMNKKILVCNRLRDNTTSSYVSEIIGTWHPATPAAITSLSFATDVAANIKAGSRIRLILEP